MKRKENISSLQNSILFLAFICIALAFAGCKVYSFTGASISPETKTISIDRFPNNALTVEPTLSQKFTDALRDKFVNETSLIIISKDGDLHLEGSIKGYRTSPVAIQGDETAALTRLTITVDVTFINTVDDSKSYKTLFTRFADFPSTQNLSEVQDGLNDQIIEMLIQDIFNKAVVNW